MVVCVLGFDIGLMLGFNNVGVDVDFFVGILVKLNFIVILGYGDLLMIFGWLL